jgi:hypothetical protein
MTSDPPQALLIYTARAQAMTGQQEQALATLKHLVRAGWKDAAFLENDQRFAGLHTSEEWKKIIAAIKQDH